MRSWSTGLAFAAALTALAACADPASITRTPDAVQLAASAGRKQPKPIACATSGRKKARGVIGRDGGSIRLGNTVLTLPAGAVTAPQKFEVHVPPSEFLEIEVTAKGHASFRFEKPVTIIVDYSRCPALDLSSLPVAMWHVDETTGALLERMNTVLDPRARTITFVTSHLSVYIMAEAFDSDGEGAPQ
jgi:hypothetical protein